jgi:MoaA/NifB/PqqE/SkfB family radical SAM enzyme
MTECAGCAAGEPRADCQGAFARAEILKVHWECWSECNLACPFCYRTRGVPLDTAEAERLVDVIVASGARAMVFAGGDPSLRRDIRKLCAYAQDAGLVVELQTNAHHLRAQARQALLDADLLGLSIDGHDAASHDALRGRRGNYERVLRTLRLRHDAGKPTVVRTLIAPQNHQQIHRLAPTIAAFDTIVRWSLVQFTAANEGFVNRDRYDLPPSDFDAAAERSRLAYHGNAQIDVYRAGDKSGTYALVTPDGRLYGTSELVDGRYPTVGSMLTEHIADLVAALGFDAEKHRNRYGDLLGRGPNGAPSRRTLPTGATTPSRPRREGSRR